MTAATPPEGRARLEATGIAVRLGGRPVLDDVGIRVEREQVVGVVGPNGSGKSTLVRVLYGAQGVSRGSVTLGDRPLTGWSRRQIAQQIAVVAQDPPPELPLRAGEAVLLGRLPHLSGLARWRTEDRRAAAEAMAATGIGHLADRLVTTLSGGERQRLLIARALAQGTDLILWDEPTNHLDLRHAHDGLGLLRRTGLCGVVVLHDLNLAARYCDHLVVLDRGRVVAQGAPETVCRSDLIAAVFGVEATVVDHAGSVQLLFRSRPDGSPPPAPPAHPDGDGPDPAVVFGSTGPACQTAAMTEADASALPSHTDSIRIAAPPATVWNLVTAMERYGEWSSENTGGYWRKGPDGEPGTGQVGDQFVGINRRGDHEWKAPVEIVERDEERAFAFVTGGLAYNYVLWRYELQPDGDGTVLTEEWTLRKLTPLMEENGPAEVEARAASARESIAATLAGMKAAAEATG